MFLKGESAKIAKLLANGSSDPMRWYGVKELTPATMHALYSEITASVMHELANGGVSPSGKKRRQKLKSGTRTPLRIVTTNSLLNASSTTVPPSHALAPFTQSGSRLLRLERALLAVSTLASTDALVRTPFGSSFSGWANAIRVRTGVARAAWTTETGYSWWRCIHSNAIKLGKCVKQRAVKPDPLDGPRLCTAAKSKG